jgi:hypothetical protein
MSEFEGAPDGPGMLMLQVARATDCPKSEVFEDVVP